MLRDLLQGFGAIQVLAASDKPSFVVGNVNHGKGEKWQKFLVMQRRSRSISPADVVALIIN
jgi:hypothetical protein